MCSSIFSVFLYSVLWLLASWPLAAPADVCWINDEQRCVIQANLQQNTSSGQTRLPMEINCSPDRLENGTPLEWAPRSLKETFLRRFERVDRVTLDGCQAPLKAATYGYEFLPNCGENLRLTVERFHGDNMLQLRCHKPLGLQVLEFQNNEIASICDFSFGNLSGLHEVYLKHNFLRYVNHLALEGLSLMKLLHIEEEYLSVGEADFLQRTSVEDVRLVALKEIPAGLTQYLPTSIRLLLIVSSNFNSREIVLVNPARMHTATIVNCGVEAFSLDDPHWTLAHLNLSGNALKHFQSAHHTNCSLRTLDLSENKLTHLREEWLRNLHCLQELDLHGNELKRLSLRHLLAAAPTVSHINLRHNKLEALSGIEEPARLQLLDCDRLNIYVDHNPWNCLWLLNFTHAHPEKFHIFQYRKFISKMNVNGLECRAEQKPTISSPCTGADGTAAKADDAINDPMPTNVSAYMLVYGNSRESRRSQRAEALTIVFLLPLGIAILFVVLYMWIYCQKIFHWSYYRSVPLLGISIRRFNARRVPDSHGSNLSGDYEAPLKDVASVCNCSFIGQELNAIPFQCQKNGAHHITYEAAPGEQAQKIYEEVAEDNHSSAEAGQCHFF